MDETRLQIAPRKREKEPDERIKNILYNLYMVNKSPLSSKAGRKREKCDDVINIMARDHNFIRSKAQYETLFRNWGWKKNRIDNDYKVIKRKYDERERKGKKTAVYWKGKCMSEEQLQKEFSRHTETVVDRFQGNLHLPDPSTPPDFKVITPHCKPAIRWDFNQLPILNFMNSSTFKDFFQAVHDSALQKSTMRDLFIRPKKNSNVFMESILPIDDLQLEVATDGIDNDSSSTLNYVQPLMLTTFLLSNNLPGDINGEALYDWLQNHVSNELLSVLSADQSLSAKSLRESVFRIAITLEDVSMVKYVLRTEIKPSNYKISCRWLKQVLNFTPLEFACSRANFELIKSLFDAGIEIQELEAGTQGSLLVLSIVGGYLREQLTSDKDQRFFFRRFNGLTSHPCVLCGFEEEDSAVDPQRKLQNPVEIALLPIIDLLLQKGAQVNCTSPAHLLGYVQSPLSIAAKYSSNEIVEYLVQNGADIGFLISGNTNILQECLYSWEEFYSMGWNYKAEWYPERCIPIHQRPTIALCGICRSIKMAETARYLLELGASSTVTSLYELDETHHEEISNDRTVPPRDWLDKRLCVLDMAALTGSLELVRHLMNHGARPTNYTLTCALKAKNPLMILHLIKHGVIRLGREGMRMLAEYPESLSSWVDSLSTSDVDRQTERSAMIYAIEHDSYKILNAVLKKGKFDWTYLLERGAEEETDEAHHSVKHWELLHDLAYALEAAILDNRFTICLMIIDGLKMCRSELNPYLTYALAAAIQNRAYHGIDFLIDNGTPLNSHYSFCSLYGVPLLEAVVCNDISLIRKLLKHGLDTKQPDYLLDGESNSVLVTALSVNNGEVVSELLKHGADINLHGYDGSTGYRSECEKTPLMAAIQGGSSRWPGILRVQGATVSSSPEALELSILVDNAIKTQDHRITMLLEACVFGVSEFIPIFEALQYVILNTAIVKMDSEFWSSTCTEVLRFYIYDQEDAQAIRWLLENTPLDLEDICNDSIVHSRIAEANQEWGFQVLDAILHHTPNTYSPWHSHSSLRNQSLFSSTGWLRYAIKENNGPIVDFILQNTICSNKRQDELPCSCNGSIFRHINIRNTQLRSKYECDQLCPNFQSSSSHESRTHSTKVDFQRFTLLQLAVLRGYNDIAMALLEHGASVNAAAADYIGATALQLASMYGYMGIVVLLLDHGADVNAPGAVYDGRTALEGAAEYGRLEIVKLLLNKGAQVCGEGQTQFERAMNFALDNGHFGVLELLQQYQDPMETQGSITGRGGFSLEDKNRVIQDVTDLETEETLENTSNDPSGVFHGSPQYLPGEYQAAEFLLEEPMAWF